jgi:methionyl-tRNA synthetase
MFLADRYVTGICPHCDHPSAYGDQCENCGSQIDQLTLINPKSTITGTAPEVRETAHWYLRLDKLEDRLRDWLNGHREQWRQTVISFCMGQMTPALRVTFASEGQKEEFAAKLPRHEAEELPGAHEWRLRFDTREACRKASEELSAVEGVSVELLGGLPERAMTRDLDWGVPVPLDDPDAAGKVLYVWFDAPIGYVSFTAKWCEENEGDWQGYKSWWKNPACKIVHFIGEDNIVFHALTWPSMLMADGTYELPDNVVANSFVNIKFPGKDEEKISKSRGTAVWIEEYLKLFDPDPLRYYLTAIAPESARTAFDIDDFVQRNNSELIAALGNFFNRWQKIATEDFERRIPQIDESLLTEDDKRILAGKVDSESATPVEVDVGKLIDACRFKEGLRRVMQFAIACNQWIDAVAPWKSRKTDRDRTAVTIYVCAHASLRLGTIMGPYLPFAAENVRSMLGMTSAELCWSDASKTLPPGHALGEPVVLFRKIDPAELIGPDRT